MDMGLIHVYCGDGKGKTTAALGLVLRCSGCGGRVVVAQFLKGQTTGEQRTLPLLPGVKLFRCQDSSKFTFEMMPQELEAAKREQNRLFDQAVQSCRNGAADLLILDEVIAACEVKLLSEEKLMDFLTTRPAGLEVVLTGRNPSERILAVADYVSEIRKLKHPYDRGIPCRQGIEM